MMWCGLVETGLAEAEEKTRTTSEEIVRASGGMVRTGVLAGQCHAVCGNRLAG